jgi:outer membrane protein assembly factor BamE (lipoprotein component of BamABCDE complex)
MSDALGQGFTRLIISLSCEELEQRLELSEVISFDSSSLFIYFSQQYSLPPFFFGQDSTRITWRASLLAEGKGGIKLNRLRESLFIFLLAFFLQSCVMLAKSKDYYPFDTSQLDTLIPGKTTAAEVTETLGAPTAIVKLSNGNAYIYRHSLSKGTGLWLVLVTLGNYDKRKDQIVIFFNKDDVMTHYGVTLDAHKAGYGLPF